MPTPVKRWPNNAAEARDRSAEELQRIVKHARRLASVANEGQITRVEVAYIASQILDASHTALRHLESQGAQTKPD